MQTPIFDWLKKIITKTIMGKAPTDPKIVEGVLPLLRAGFSESMVIREMKKK